MKLFKTKDQKGLHNVLTSADDAYLLGYTDDWTLKMITSRNLEVFSLALIECGPSMKLIETAVVAIVRTGGLEAARKIGLWNTPVQESLEATQRLVDLHTEYCASTTEKLFIFTKKNPSMKLLYEKLIVGEPKLP